MKNRVLVTVTVAALALIGGVWLVSRHSQPKSQPVSGETDSVASQPARSGSSQGEVSRARRADSAANIPAPGTSKSVAMKPGAAVDPVQAATVNRALDELNHIYAPAGAMDWDKARALIARRNQASKELVDRLAALGSGGAGALAASYPQTDSVRAKLLLIHALSRVNDPEAASALATLLAGDTDYSLRKEMIVALGQRTEAAAQQTLSEILATQDDAQLRFASAQALAGRESALPALAGRLRAETEPDVQRELVRSVSLVGNNAAMNVLAGVARSSADVALRQTAVQELGRAFGTSALGALEGLLNDPNEAIRTSAVNALTRFKADSAIALLQRVAATDASAAVRGAAAARLASLQPGPNTPANSARPRP